MRQPIKILRKSTLCGTVAMFIAGVLVITAACRGFPNSEALIRHESARELIGGQLRVEVMDPNARVPYYQGNRFSSVANVLRVTMNGHDFLFSPLAHDPAMENAGLAMEFDLKQWPEGGPPGFAQAAQGEVFTKVGVGLLKKTGDAYAFYKPYKTIALAPTEVEWKTDRACFHQRCHSPSGYGYLLEAEVDVRARTVEIKYRLENTGERPFATEQYAHNFFSFDQTPSGPGYELEFSADFSMARNEQLQRYGRQLRFADFLPPNKAINATIEMVPREEARESVTVRHLEKKMSVVASVSRPTAHVAIHASSAYLCPEQFVRIKLQPGETAAWVRSYEFIREETVAPLASISTHRTH